MTLESPKDGENPSKPPLNNAAKETGKLTPFVPTFEEERSAIEINPAFIDETSAGREQRMHGEEERAKILQEQRDTVARNLERAEQNRINAIKRRKDNAV